jgi:hypothetical protein
VAVSPRNGDWRPTALAAGLGVLFSAFGLAGVTRQFYELKLPDIWGFALIGLVLLAWAVSLRAFWRTDLVGLRKRILRQ